MSEYGRWLYLSFCKCNGTEQSPWKKKKMLWTCRAGDRAYSHLLTKLEELLVPERLWRKQHISDQNSFLKCLIKGYRLSVLFVYFPQDYQLEGRRCQGIKTRPQARQTKAATRHPASQVLPKTGQQAFFSFDCLLTSFFSFLFAIYRCPNQTLLGCR
jgi:hypothetical protein